jgi:hypothetical protein
MERSLKWVPIPDVDSLDRDLRELFPLIPCHDPPLAPRDEAVFLLQIAAEVEHSLLVQYLFAFYGIELENFSGPKIPPNASLLASGWMESLRSIALQEMGHLMTVQNILLFVGGAAHFDRPVFPHRTDFYPFSFELEVLTKDSIAKYVAAEMPPIEPKGVLKEVILRARGAEGGHFVNRVGALYAALRRLFGPRGPITDRDCDFCSVQFQASPDDWRLPPGFILMQIHSRAEAERALQLIAEQGEGPTNCRIVKEPSHYDQFFNMYFKSECPHESFPETDAVLGTIDWTVTKPVVRNPTTMRSDARCDSNNLIRSPVARLWAQFFNLRYRMLLTQLVHYLQIASDSELRKVLSGAATFEMRRALKGIAAELTMMDASAVHPGNAGPPFEIDYDLAPSSYEVNRWRLHRDLLFASRALIGELKCLPLSQKQTSLLKQIEANDTDLLVIVEKQISS